MGRLIPGTGTDIMSELAPKNMRAKSTALLMLAFLTLMSVASFAQKYHTVGIIGGGAAALNRNKI